MMVSHGNTFDILYSFLLEMITIPMERDIYTVHYFKKIMSKETENAIFGDFFIM